MNECKPQTAGLALPLMALALLAALPIPLAFLRRGSDARNGPAPGMGAFQNKLSKRKLSSNHLYSRLNAHTDPRTRLAVTDRPPDHRRNRYPRRRELLGLYLMST